MKLFPFALLSVALGSILPAPTPRPLVVWHGLGDSYASEGMIEFEKMVEDLYPGIFVHRVYLDTDNSADRKATFFGKVNEQIEIVARQLADIKELRDGFDAVGFSQGGQFLRAYVERYNDPPVRNLITFGSQHMGIADIPECRPADLLCRLARQVARSAAYGEWAQNNLIQAQYYRDTSQYETYLASNAFLASINNEIPGARNETYARNLATVDNLVLILFDKDRTVVPKETAWFGSEPIRVQPPGSFSDQEQTRLGAGVTEREGGNRERVIIPMRDQPIYAEDWIGLRELDERGGISFEVCHGEHMRIGDCWERIAKQFVGGNVRNVD